MDNFKSPLLPEIFKINGVNICSETLDGQEANRRVAQQRRIRHMFLERRFMQGKYTSIAIVDYVKETSSHSDAEENLTVIHYLISLISFDMVDHVPSNIPEGSVPAILYISDGNKADIRMSIKGRSPNLRHVSPTHRVDLDWLFERIDLDSSLSTRDVRTTEHITSTTTQLMPLLRFFDTHPPFNLNVRPQPFSESSCSAVSRRTPLAISNACIPQRDIENGPWDEKLEDSSNGIRSAWKNRTQDQTGSSSSAWRNPMLDSSRHAWKPNASFGTTKRRARRPSIGQPAKIATVTICFVRADLTRCPFNPPNASGWENPCFTLQEAPYRWENHLRKQHVAPLYIRAMQ